MPRSLCLVVISALFVSDENLRKDRPRANEFSRTIVTSDDVRAIGDADEILVRVEADRIALRRAFEDGESSSVNEQTTNR
jgi:hypothetical protein